MPGHKQQARPTSTQVSFSFDSSSAAEESLAAPSGNRHDSCCQKTCNQSSEAGNSLEPCFCPAIDLASSRSFREANLIGNISQPAICLLARAAKHAGCRDSPLTPDVLVLWWTNPEHNPPCCEAEAAGGQNAQAWQCLAHPVSTAATARPNPRPVPHHYHQQPAVSSCAERIAWRTLFIDGPRQT